MDKNRRSEWCGTAHKAVLQSKAAYMGSEYPTHYDKARMTAKVRKALDLIGGVLEASTEYRAEVMQTAAMAAMNEVSDEMIRLDRMRPVDPSFVRDRKEHQVDFFTNYGRLEVIRDPGKGPVASPGQRGPRAAGRRRV